MILVWRFERQATAHQGTQGAMLLEDKKDQI